MSARWSHRPTTRPSAVAAWLTYWLCYRRMTIFTDLTLLRGFVSIVDSGSISAAARHLHLTQSTLSRRLQSLEDQCGTVLLRRDTHRMHLTDTGHRLLADARALLALAEESEQRLRNEQTAVEGNIRIFATIDFGQSVVSRMIASFIQAHPAVTAELAYSNRPLHMIEEGCDAGVIAGNLTDETVIARSVGRIKRYPVAAPSFLGERKSPKFPADIQPWPWLTLSNLQFDVSNSVDLYSAQGEKLLEVKPVMTSEGVTSLREAIRMGLGIAVLPEWLIEDDLVSGRLVRVLPKWQARELPAHVVYPAQRRLPVRVRTFIDFAVDYMSTVLKPRHV
jgi:DNA-binding transcriptional LysR family regulator